MTNPLRRRSVEVATIDAVLAGQPAVDRWLIKIDVAGMELAVLRGAEQTMYDGACVASLH